MMNNRDWGISTRSKTYETAKNARKYLKFMVKFTRGMEYESEGEILHQCILHESIQIRSISITLQRTNMHSSTMWVEIFGDNVILISRLSFNSVIALKIIFYS